MKIKYSSSQVSGLTRHRLIVASCVAFAGLVLAVSVVDLHSLVSREATIDKAFHIKYAQRLAELPPNLTYTKGSSYKNSNDADEYTAGLRSVREATWDGDRLGFVNSAGKIVIKPHFSSVQEFNGGLAAAALAPEERKVGTRTVTRPLKWGYIDKSGKWVIRPRFQQCTPFHDGVATVSYEDEASNVNYVGLIDTSGKILVQSREVRNGVLPRRIGDYYVMNSSGKYGIVDKNGQWVVQATFDSIDNVVEISDQDNSNRFRQPGSGDAFDACSESRELSETPKMLLATKDEHCGVIDCSGNIIVPLKFKQLGNYHNGAWSITEDEKSGFIGKDGKVLLEAKYESPTAYDELIAVKNGKTWSVIDKNGQAVKTAAFDNPNIIGGPENQAWFSEGLAPVRVKDKIGYLNSKGEMAIKPIFAEAMAFHNGYAEVWDGSAWRYIDKTGKFASPLRFESASPFNANEAVVSVPGPLHFIAAARNIENMNGYIKNRNASAEEANN